MRAVAGSVVAGSEEVGTEAEDEEAAAMVEEVTEAGVRAAEGWAVEATVGVAMAEEVREAAGMAAVEATGAGGWVAWVREVLGWVA